MMPLSFQTNWMAVLVLFLCVTMTLAAAIPTEDGLTARAQYHQHPNGIQPSSIDTTPLIQRFKKRGFLTTSDLSLSNINDIQAIFPKTPAAAAICIFFNTLLSHTIHSWASQPPQRTLIVRYGAFELAMFASGDDPIPWAWLEEFARMMINASVRGFASTCMMTYMHPEAYHAITVALSLRAGMALETMGALEVGTIIPVFLGGGGG